MVKYRLDDVATAVASAPRRAIIERLSESDASMTVLAQHLAVTLPAVDKHLRVLRDAGLVKVRIDAQKRVYGLEAKPLAELDAWLAPYRRYWADRLDDLERSLDA
jgi:DNA-binding transcriptional ArsR family regulator